jgi:Acetyltransferase (GNAT) family
VSDAITIRELRDDERAWANELYREIQFATSPPDAMALVAELNGERVGLGRLLWLAPDVMELGGIWTSASVRLRGVARTMVEALIARLPGEGAAGEGAAGEGAAGEDAAGEGAAGEGAAGEGAAGEGDGGRREGTERDRLVWCIPFAHLSAFYESFGFAVRPPPWPSAIAAKVAAVIAEGLPDVAVLARSSRRR